MITAWLLAIAPAWAQLADGRSGVWVDLGAGVAMADLPPDAGPSWTLGVGGWLGRYDDSFAIGRRWDLGARISQVGLLARREARLRTTATFEVSRTLDLLVIGVHVGGGVGALVDAASPTLPDAFGLTARAHGAVTWRFHPTWRILARLDAGVDAVDLPGAGWAPTPVLALHVGVAASFPVGGPARDAAR